MDKFTTISKLARRLGIPPRKISDQFYSRALDDSACPIIDGRRFMPADYVPTIERVLSERGVIKQGRRAMTRKDAPAPVALGIDANSVYPLVDFQKRMSFGRHFMRSARRAGLPILRFGGRSFVAASDFLSFLREQSEAPVDEGAIEP